jgi:hypothetical protein
VSYTPVANVDSRKAHWLSAVACRLDIITLVALIVASTPLASLLSKAPLPVAQLNVLDDSWRIDIIYKALSRSVVRPQCDFYLWSALPAHNSYTSTLVRILIKDLLLNQCCHTYMGYHCSYFWYCKDPASSEPAWKRALFLVLVVGFWSPLEVRTSTLLFFYAVFVACVAKSSARARGYLFGQQPVRSC